MPDMTGRPGVPDSGTNGGNSTSQGKLSRDWVDGKRLCMCCFGSFLLGGKLDDRQITHLICVRQGHVLYDCFRGCFGPFI